MQEIYYVKFHNGVPEDSRVEGPFESRESAHAFVDELTRRIPTVHTEVLVRDGERDGIKTLAIMAIVEQISRDNFQGAAQICLELEVVLQSYDAAHRKQAS